MRSWGDYPSVWDRFTPFSGMPSCPVLSHSNGIDGVKLCLWCKIGLRLPRDKAGDTTFGNGVELNARRDSFADLGDECIRERR
jgi:hypothetical protein